MVDCPTWIHDCLSHSFALLDIFLSSDLSICSAVVSSPLGNLDDVALSVSVNFLSKITPFDNLGFDYSCDNWDGCYHLRRFL